MSLEVWSSIITFGGGAILAIDAFLAPRRAEAKEGADLIDEELPKAEEAQQLQQQQALQAQGQQAQPAQPAQLTQSANQPAAKPRERVGAEVERQFAAVTRNLTIIGFLVLSFGFLLDLIAKSRHP